VPRGEHAPPLAPRAPRWREALPVLAAAFLFNLGQGVLRPSLPLYLRAVFGASYRMVTLIPVVFSAGKWAASLPTGYLLHRLGRTPLMVGGLAVVAVSDIASLVAVRYGAFLGVRGLAGAGWAMFATVATTAMVQRGARGRALSLLLVSESLGLLLGSATGGWLYERAGLTSPFLAEAACMAVAALVVGWSGVPAAVARPPRAATESGAPSLRAIVRVRGVMLACVVNAAVMGVQTGVLVFLFPLYLAERGGFTPRSVGHLVALGVLGRVAALWFAGGVADRRDRPSVLALGLGGFAVVLVTVPLVGDGWLLGAWALLIGAAGGFVASLPTAIVGDRVDPSAHGVAIGWLRTVTDTGMVIGPLVMGPLADALGLDAPFILAAVLLGALAWACRAIR
jgi:predicted MFS family arabinose efflux permease